MVTKTETLYAYVLHRRPYQERGALLELMSERGRLSVVTRKDLAHPFQLLWLELAGRGELKTLRRCEPVGPAVFPEGMALYAGLYLNELTYRLLPREWDHPSLWQLYRQTCSQLLIADARAIEAALRRYELELLQGRGDEHRLTHTRGGEPIRAQERYRWDPRHGFSVAIEGIPGSSLQAMACADFTQEEVLQQARSIFRAMIDHALGGRTLHARQLYRQALATRDPDSVLGGDMTGQQPVQPVR